MLTSSDRRHPRFPRPPDGGAPSQAPADSARCPLLCPLGLTALLGPADAAPTLVARPAPGQPPPSEARSPLPRRFLP
jgi:hypothetical protein